MVGDVKGGVEEIVLDLVEWPSAKLWIAQKPIVVDGERVYTTVVVNPRDWTPRLCDDGTPDFEVDHNNHKLIIYDRVYRR